MRTKSLAIAVATVALGATLAACGNGDDQTGSTGGASRISTSPSATTTAQQTPEFNAADITFATDMIPHHQQALEMAKLAQGRTTDPRVTQLAQQIMKAQDPEIQTMTGWLRAWGRPVPQDMSGMDMSGSMPGMMSTDDMNTLKSSSGTEFDTTFLKMMIKHHRGAIQMAETELASGSNADAKALAAKVKAAQTTEISTMESLLK
ncbi:MAG TPA: DUF305 domain-containing protein [Marmoricola sp.]|nr:DUF305 domain-containing protein [Marmoricola sp.]